MFRIRTLLIISFVSFSFLLTAQNRDKEKRSTVTRIADLLAEMPSTNASRLEDLMAEMAAFDENELVSITGMLTAPGNGNDSQVRFAINGFSLFVMGVGKETSRHLCEGAWCKALDQAKDKEVKAFLISQLQIMGSDASVPFLAPYLADERLCDPAARALVVIRSPGAAAALLKALGTSHAQQQVTLIQALGDIRNENAVESILKLVNSGNINIQKAVLYALGNSGAPTAGKILYNEARKSGFTYEPSRAAASFLLWLDRTGENGNIKVVKKQSGLLMKECAADNQSQTRAEALAILVKYTREDALPVLLASSDSPNPEYRNAALKLSDNLKGEKITGSWITKAGKLRDQPKADVITMLGNRGDQSALPFIISSLSDPSKQVRMAAVTSAQKLGQEKSLSNILAFMKAADEEEIGRAKQALLSMHGDKVVSEIGTVLPQMSSSGKIALIEVLASRHATEYLSLVRTQINSDDARLKSAAISALPELVSKNDLPDLFKLLTQAEKAEDIVALQKAVISALKESGTPDDQSETVIQNMNRQNNAIRSRYFTILSEIGGIKAYKTLFSIFDDRSNAGNSDSAFNAYVRLVNRSGYPADQRFLMLRKAMESPLSTEQKRTIIKSLENINSFTALVFAGKYLDDPLLKSDAAYSVMRIGMADTCYYGNITKDLLNKAMSELSGSEGDYQREAIRKYLASRPVITGFVPLFNGKDLSGWKGLVENPLLRAKMSPKELKKKQDIADDIMRKGWYVQDGMLIFGGNGENLCTTKAYGDFEMLVDWKIAPDGDAGIYLRGSPQVQIWDASRSDTEAKVGSGGLFNNMVNEKNPIRVADNPVGDWNTFRIKMTGERVTVHLNGQLVVDNTILENYWDRSIPIFPMEQIELQAHGSLLGYRDIYIKEIPRPEPYKVTVEEKSAGFTELFDGMSLFSWIGNTKDYQVENGNIVFHPNNGGVGNLYTRGEYRDFILRFDFQLTPAGNSGIGIRAPLEGDAAYVGMEIQVLDDDADVYKNLEKYQYHGSVYGVIPAKRGFLKPVGEWNSEEIIMQGSKIKVTLNGTVIVDGDIAEASKNGTMDHKDHPGLKNEKGHMGFLSHDSPVKFKNIRIKTMQ